MNAPTLRRPVTLIVLAAIVLLAIVVAVFQRGPAAADPGSGASPITFDFDVAEDGTRFLFDDAPLFDDGLPAAGNGFVTRGFIYADGTLGDHDGVVIDANGTAVPEFPEAVIGTWTCWGSFINDAAHEGDDPWVVTTQLYEFDDGSSLVSVGTELPQDAGTSVRAITGGTGDYAHVTGELEQTTNGHNGTDGVNGDFRASLLNRA